MRQRIHGCWKIRGCKMGQIVYDPGFEHRTWGSARAVGEKKMEIVSATNVADRNDDGVEITAKRRNKTESRADSRANGSARASLCCAAVSKCIARTEIV